MNTFNDLTPSRIFAAYSAAITRRLVSDRELTIYEQKTGWEIDETPVDFEAVTIYSKDNSFQIITKAGNGHKVGDITG